MIFLIARLFNYSPAASFGYGMPPPKQPPWVTWYTCPDCYRVEVDKVRAPWTDERIKALNEYQADNNFHPYTCPFGHGALVATPEGWRCGKCDYTQDWAHDFMTRKYE